MVECRYGRGQPAQFGTSGGLAMPQHRLPLPGIQVVAIGHDRNRLDHPYRLIN